MNGPALQPLVSIIEERRNKEVPHGSVAHNGPIEPIESFPRKARLAALGDCKLNPK